MNAHNLEHPWTSRGLRPQAIGIPGRENGCFAKLPVKTQTGTNAPGISQLTAYARREVSMEYPRWQFSPTWLPLLDAAGKHWSCKNQILSRRGRKSRGISPNVNRRA